MGARREADSVGFPTFVVKCAAVLLRLASMLVPPSLRAEWLEGWRDELDVRCRSGGGPRAFWHHAISAWRDALWVRQRHPHGAIQAFFARPFRAEAAIILLAALCWGATRFAPPAPLPFPTADRAVFLERGIAALGGRRPIMSRALVEKAGGIPEFENVALFQVNWRSPAYARVSGDFFDVLGLKPMLGRTLQPGDSGSVTVLTHDYWRVRFQSDPSTVGSNVDLGMGEFEVLGVLPPDFEFLSERISYFIPLSHFAKKVGGVAVLRPGADRRQAQERFRQLAREAEPSWGEHGFGLRPLAHRHSPSIFLAAGLAAVGFVLGGAFFLWRGVARWRHYLTFAFRIVVLMSALTVIQSSVSAFLGQSRPATIFHTLAFLLICVTALILIVRDHLRRCPICLERLAMPASFGTWSSVFVDPPATEYVCPKGHGMLLEEETGEMQSRWTLLDKSWKDLFVK